MIVLGVATLVAIAVLVVARVWMNPAGGPATSITPTTTSKPVPVPSTSIRSAPPGFPDMDGFVDVSRDHEVSHLYPLATFTSPTGLECAMSSNRGGTAASCYGPISGLDQPANLVYADDYGARFDHGTTPGDAAKRNGKPLASGQKVVLGAGGTLMGGDQITCGAQDQLIACVVVRAFDANHGADTAQRHGFVLSPQGSWTF